ncbi:alsin [Anastrepha ludens]|uniref:alsin n=1 Tax=Anastrepha ludens TaxID=28586 RepID=UPI0023B0C3A0|nr:alsin [Anastrepha ludens]
MSISDVSTESELTVAEEEEERINIGLYIGQRNAASQRHGRGWAILPNGDQYDGQYRQGRRHGIGLYVFKDGSRYYGSYRCGHRSGRGMFIYPDGSMYEGCWRKNIKHGKGRYKYANGDCYMGNWYRGLRHGVGVYCYKSSDCGELRFKGTWRLGFRVGPFQIFFGNEDHSTILHGTWDNEYPQGPAVFTFNERYMLMGYFQTPGMGYKVNREVEGDAEEVLGEAEGVRDEPGVFIDMLPSKWFAQDICCYDYSQLPQEPIPLPLSDSEVSVCSLSTVPTELTLERSVLYVGEAEEEGEGECVECIPCEGVSESEIETESEPICSPQGDPCAIEIIDENKEC